MLSRRGHRAHAGSARACRARPRRPRPARSRRSCSFASIPSARAISLRSRSISARRVPVRLRRSGLHDRVEDPLLVALERRRARRCAGRSRAASCTRVERVGVGVVRARRAPARARRSAALSRAGRCVQISSVTCGITGWSSFSSRSSAASAVALRIGVAVVEPRLDRLGVPVAEVVEDEVVERCRRPRRTSKRGSASSTSARVALEPREDPALLDVARPHVRRRALRRQQDSRDTFQSLFASLRALLDRRVREAHVLRATTSSAGRSASRRRRARRSPRAGRSPVPSDFDIRRPSGASTVEWMITSRERDLAAAARARRRSSGSPRGG